MNTAQTILDAKSAAGPDAYLWAHSSGDCILWASEEAAENSDGCNAIARWSLTIDELDELIGSGEVDDVV